MYKSSFGTAVFAVILLAQSTGAGLDTPSGVPLEGEDIIQLVINPADTSTLHAIATSGRFFSSTDAGATWASSHSFRTNSVFELTFDPTDSDTLYAVPGYIERTIDGGETWTTLYLPGGLGVLGGAVDPRDSATLYAATSHWDIYKSSDGGATWTKPNSLMRGLADVAVDVADSNVIYVAAGILDRSFDRGTTWAPSEPQIFGHPNRLVLDPTDPNILYVDTKEGLFRSRNAGATLTPVSPLPLPAPGTQPTGHCPLEAGHNRTVSDVVASAPEVLYAPSCFGVFKTVDRGDTWMATAWSAPANVVAVDPRNPQTVYTAATDGVFKSIDGGDTWQAADELVDNRQTASGGDGCSVAKPFPASKHGMLLITAALVTTGLIRLTTSRPI